MIKHRLLILAAAALASAACSRAGSNDDAFQYSDRVPDGSVLHIRDGAGDIHVTRGAGPNVTLRANTSWHRGRSSDIKFIAVQNGSDYYVCAMWRNSGRCDGSDNRYRGRNTGGPGQVDDLFPGIHQRNNSSAAPATRSGVTRVMQR